jgi:glycosyltransferase involved in cell wall biosynthesis
MRIAMVSEHASPLASLGGEDAGAQNVHVRGLAAALAARGHSVTVYTRRDGSMPERVPAGPGVEVVHVSAGPADTVPRRELPAYTAEFTQRLIDRWDEESPDVVHAHFWNSGVAALRAAWALDGPPVVQTLHSLEHLERRQGGDVRSAPARRRLEPAVARQADQLIAMCSEEAFELARLGVSSRRIAVVPQGVDTRRFSPEGPAELKRRATRLVSVGRIAPRKDVDSAIRALAELVASGRDDVELVVVGGSVSVERPLDDPEVARLAGLARSLGVREHVDFRGWVSHDTLPRLLRSADVLVATPRYEPFGVVALEAMACGIPVVASAVGGLLDTVVHGTTGLHVPPGDLPVLVRTLALLIDYPRLRARLGPAGVDRARTAFTWEQVAMHTERIYFPLVSTHRAHDARRTVLR